MAQKLTFKFCPICANPLQRRVLNGAERQACPTENCNFVHWDNPIPVVAALVKFDDRYLLARNHGWPHEVFSLISGFLEHGESPDQAIAREINEELGLHTSAVQFAGYQSFFPRNQLILTFLVTANGRLRLGDEIEETRLVERQTLETWDFGPLKLSRIMVDACLALPNS